MLAFSVNRMFLSLLFLCVCWRHVSCYDEDHEEERHGVDPSGRNVTCDPTSRYRSFDGSCNNLRHPTFGVAGSTFRRILPPKYENGDGRTPRLTGVTGAKLPSPRLVSVTVHGPGNDTADDANMMLTQWGQFLAHDLTRTLQASFNGSCCSSDLVTSGVLHPDVVNGGPCFPIIVDRMDRHFDDVSTRCMEFQRSDHRTDLTNTRQQYNEATSWIDASHIYGHTEDRARSLRSFNNGKLKVITVNGEDFLPENVEATEKTCFKLQAGDYCFKAGDVRVNFYPGLSALHTMFLRYHNKICDRLKPIHGDWSDEILYQEARRLVIAVIQRITYDEFMVQILGQAASKYGLLFGNYSYNSSIDPTLSNVFSTAAYRFGHSLVSDSLTINGQVVETGDVFTRPKFVLNSLKGVTEAFLRGRSHGADRWFAKGMTDRMFEKPNKPKTGFDIVARNIQRGRDHGIRPYNDWLEHFGFPRATFETIGQVYGRVYSSVDDVDLYGGAAGETRAYQGRVGQLYSAILGAQFRDLKFGDRFWFENLDDVSSFTADQVSQIAGLKLSRVICDTVAGITKIQLNAFQTVSPENSLADCSTLADVDIERFWV
ncbi:unnamed protein product [Lymnaea stagnalis]|uniref:Uncharacterized protein n=1 Tax=Lymnaea stagnalis TaxID=6523 RepID=A0AAV2H7A7_LYMST